MIERAYRLLCRTSLLFQSKWIVLYDEIYHRMTESTAKWVSVKSARLQYIQYISVSPGGLWVRTCGYVNWVTFAFTSACGEKRLVTNR
ncbi:uncharacterized [Tachysurus ichikawai]